MVERIYKGLYKNTRRNANGQKIDYWYHRATNTRVLGEFGTEEFSENYDKVVSAQKTFGRPKTLNELITAFKASSNYRGLGTNSKRNYSLYFKLLKERLGSLPLEAFNDVQIRGVFFDLRDEFIETPRTADYLIQTARRLINWAYDRGDVKFAHLSRPGRVYDNDRSQIIWEPHQVSTFMQHAYFELNLAVTFALFLGQRQGDLVRLRESQYQIDSKTNRRWMIVQQQKSRGKVTVEVPVHYRFAEAIDSLLAEQNQNQYRVDSGGLFLRTKTGVPWKEDHLRHEMLKTQKLCGLEDLNFHDLRGTAVTMLSESGCTPQEIVTFTGHSLKTVEEILDKYLARTKKIATNAVEKLEAHMDTNFVDEMLFERQEDHRLIQ